MRQGDVGDAAIVAPSAGPDNGCGSPGPEMFQSLLMEDGSVRGGQQVIIPADRFGSAEAEHLGGTGIPGSDRSVQVTGDEGLVDGRRWRKHRYLFRRLDPAGLGLWRIGNGHRRVSCEEPRPPRRKTPRRNSALDHDDL